MIYERKAKSTETINWLLVKTQGCNAVQQGPENTLEPGERRVSPPLPSLTWSPETSNWDMVNKGKAGQDAQRGHC